MLTLPSLTGRLVWARWPMLLAWYLAGMIGRFAAIELAGYVGAYSAVAGTLLLPLAVLCRLISYTAMFLVLRDSMPHLSTLAPLPSDARLRRREFVSAVAGAILPFFAFYTALGYQREDAQEYYVRVHEIDISLRMTALVEDRDQLGDGALGALNLGPVTIAIIALAYALRWLLKRYQDRLPRALSFFGVYLEAIWVWLSVTLIAGYLGTFRAWIEERQASQWLDQARENAMSLVQPLAWVADAVNWVLGAAGGVMLIPVAWLTVAGVIYGRAIAVEPAAVRGNLLDRAREQVGAMPERAQRRISDVWSDFTARFQPVWSAFMLMWRAGPALFGTFVFVYAVLELASPWLEIWVFRAFGPHEPAFWAIVEVGLGLLVTAIVEPVRIALIAAGYDRTIGRLQPKEPDPAGAGGGETNPADPSAKIEHEAKG